MLIVDNVLRFQTSQHSGPRRFRCFFVEKVHSAFLGEVLSYARTTGILCLCCGASVPYHNCETSCVIFNLFVWRYEGS